MPELTLESLAARLTEVEREMAALKATSFRPAWLDLVGSMTDDELTRQWIAEMDAIRDGERQATQESGVDDCDPPVTLTAPA